MDVSKKFKGKLKLVHLESKLREFMRIPFGCGKSEDVLTLAVSASVRISIFADVLLTRANSAEIHTIISYREGQPSCLVERIPSSRFFRT